MDTVKNENSKIIEEAIVRAIAFFDLFDYPLTSWQVWKYICVKCGFEDVLDALNNLRGSTPGVGVEPLIYKKQGFYFLSGREEIIKTRSRRYNYSVAKIKRAILVSKIFKFIPWIQMIAVGNTIGELNLKEESDIDLFIITEPGRIWITRFFTIIITKFLGLRPKQNKNRDKICLSFFIDSDHLNLERFMLQDSENLDQYFIYWLASIFPVYEKDKIYGKLIKENTWIYNDLPNWNQSGLSAQYDAGKSFSWFYHDVFDMLLGGLEDNAKKVQLKIMPERLKSVMNTGTTVVINDHVLKLHANDRREEYREKYKSKLIEIYRN